MPRRLSIQEQEILAGGGTISLSTTEYVDIYRIYSTGTVTLTSNVTIQASGTPELGMEYIFHYVADLDYASNKFTVFGADIPPTLQDKELFIRCYYTGSAWEVVILPDFDGSSWITGSMITALTLTSGLYAAQSVDTAALKDANVTSAKLASSSVGTSNIIANAVTIGKLETKANKFSITVPVSFESGEQSENSIIMPFDGTLTSVRYVVTKAIAATDNGTITPLVNGVATTPANITLTASTVINTTLDTTITAGNTFTAGQVIKMTTAKTTAGGKLLLTLSFTRT